MKDYSINLCYGYEESSYGLSFAFDVLSPDEPIPSDIGDALAAEIDAEPDSDDFNYDFLEIQLPEAIVRKIRTDAVNEFAELIKRTAAEMFTAGEDDFTNIALNRLIAEATEKLADKVAAAMKEA